MLLPYLLLLFQFSSVHADCPTGTFYEAPFNKCYQLNGAPLSFATAEEQCNQFGGHLLAIQNAYEGSYINENMLFHGFSPKYWIGANQLQSANWSWTTGDAMSYTNWALGQSPDPGKKCAAVQTSSATWMQEECNTAYPYVCSFSPNVTAPGNVTTLPTVAPTGPSVCPADPVCDPGYTLFNGTCRCYKLDTHLHTWNRSQEYCSKEGAHLPTITSPALNAFLLSLLSGNSGDYDVWIGLTCPNSQSISECYWVDGSRVGDGYSNFNGESLLGGTAVAMESLTGQWETFAPGGGFFTFCEKDSSSRSEEVDEDDRRRAPKLGD